LRARLLSRFLLSHFLVTHAEIVAWVGVFSGVSVRLCFNTMSQKPLQLGSPNVTQKCTTMSLGNPFILGSEDQRSRSKGTKTLLEWVLTLF